MARRGPSDIQKQEAALQGVQRMIAPREHPVYRLRAAPGRLMDRRRVRWLAVVMGRRSDALAAARAINRGLAGRHAGYVRRRDLKKETPGGL